MSKLDDAYAPPRSNVTPSPGENDGELVDASNNVRLANLIIDGICRLVFAVVVGVVCGLAGVDVSAPGIGFLFGLITIFLYYVFFEGLFGFTIGKLITGTRVVTLDGRKPGLGAVMGRTLARFVPFEPFSFLGAGEGWHDKWSGTRVVRVRR